MPNNLNEISCGGNGSGNVGLTPCGYTLLRNIAAIAAPLGATIPDSALASVAAFYAFLLTKLQATNYIDRWFIIGKFSSQEGNGQEAAFYTSPGSRNRVLVQQPVRSMRYLIEQGFCYHRQLYSINPQGYRFFEVALTTTSDVLVVGTALQDPTTQKISFAGFSKSLFYPEPPVAATDTVPELYYLQMEDSDITESTVNRTVFKINNNFLNSLQPFAVKDVLLENRTPTGAAAGVFTIRPNVSCGGLSLAELIPALASATYILGTNSATGGAITATTVAIDTTDPANIVVTLDTTDADYPAAGGFINFKLAGLGVVLTPIGAYESNILTLPRS